MAMLLAGDIGGTKTILSLVETTPGATPEALPTLTFRFQKKFSSRQYPDLVPLVRQFLQDAQAAEGAVFNPVGACFGIAGPVVDNTSELTNLSWSLHAQALSQKLAIPQVNLINDFAATGYGVLGLSAKDVYTLQTGEPDLTAPIAIIGAGTGLGQGFLIRHTDGYRTYGSEGGHADFAPRCELEFELLRYLLERHAINRVSAERVISGMGIVAIYQFLRDRFPDHESAAMVTLYRSWEKQVNQDPKTIDLAAEVSRAALEQQDSLCQKAMDLFLDAYGAEAGNLALKLLPYGGLYIAGGIAAKNLPFFQTGRFIAAFTQKGRVSPLLHKVPVHLVLNSDVALIGAALYAAKHS